MSFYRYEAVDRSGKTVNGTMDAPNESEVNARLAQQGFSPLKVTPAPTNGAKSQSVPGKAVTLQQIPVKASSAPESKLGGAGAKDQALFFRQFAALVRSGITLYQALEHLGPRTMQPALRQTAHEMAVAAHSGEQISSVMEKYPRLFARHIVASVRAAETGGFIEIVLDEIALDYEQEMAFYKGAGLLKAMLVQGIIAIAIGQPVFPHLFPPPSHWGTYFMLVFLRNLPIAGALLLGLKWWLKRLNEPENLMKRDSLLLKLPVFGDLVRQHALSSFVRMLRKLFQAGVSPITAWEGAMWVTPNAVIREKLVESHGMMQHNVPLHDAFSATGLFANETEQLLATGMVSGQMVDMLDRVAEYYQNNVDRAFGQSRFWMQRLAFSGAIALAGTLVIWLTVVYYQSVFEYPAKLFPELDH
jgi:type IV pilus assembly protein PilC